MESSYATSIELQNSVAVETAERGLSLPSIMLAWELFNYRLTELSMCWLACCKFMPVSGVSVVCIPFLPESCCVCIPPLWLPGCPTASILDVCLSWKWCHQSCTRVGIYPPRLGLPGLLLADALSLWAGRPCALRLALPCFSRGLTRICISIACV